MSNGLGNFCNNYQLYTVLKPQGFRKSGSCFRRELENGIVWEVEIQKSQFNMPSQGWSQYDELLQQYHKKSMEEEILRFVERSTEAEIVELETEIR